MNQQSDVIVIGGGIIGCATAYYLAKSGVSVTLLEKDTIAHEQSSRAWGFVRQQRRDPAELPLMIEANRMWPQLEAELDAKFEWTQRGILAVADSDERMDYYRTWYEQTKHFGVESRLLSTAEIRAMNPEMQGAWVGGIFTPSDGHAEPLPATRAFANAARRLGADIRTDTTVEGIDVAGGSVRGVMASGVYLPARTVVCAAGIWSSRLARTVGLSLPQIGIRQTVVEIDPLREITPVATWTPTIAFRQRPSGTVYLARPDDGDYDLNLDSIRFAREFVPNFRANRNAFRINITRELFRDLKRIRPRSRHWRRQFRESVGTEPAVNSSVAERCRYSFIRLFPNVGNAPVRRVFGGIVDATPDALPVMGESHSLPGFVWATGFSGHGFGIGPIAGKLLAQLIDEGKTEFDLGAFRAERFAESRDITTTKIA